ncbi:hypothetical protein TCAL_13985 [Tigriopus californicus]|uniref:TLC domain-containing protein n=1 Tax=Tigriopus californicus TaxID=6832 RepID=A0A553NX60_TIGCA|nr:ceramide synthase 6-like [Tigriopus californicus]TRY70008.1 hypothetical protein TCAL_13985 [Tigriopus californicus]|eukprot:TCALIF_13985-PA protein Name:"Similar to CERS6 Ceramide synthase 6 (Homo sapiens)" AED:0.04 eAED:0.04 QI:0/-1/0/1/-1/1/1/0/370
MTVLHDGQKPSQWLDPAQFGLFRWVVDWASDDQFWLPPNITWATLEASEEGMQFARSSDLRIPMMAAFAVYFIRIFVQNKVFRYLGVCLGLKDQRRVVPPENPILEAAFKNTKRLDHSRIRALSKESDMTERQVERWIRQRSLVGKSSKLDKFCESGWKALYYTLMYAYSWVILWDKPWFWDIKYCWYKYPFHDVSTGIWLYYMIELSFYWSLLISQFFDVQRSDFWEMFAHHIAAILLLSLSWACNLFRVGTLVLWVHDCADVFLESAKMFRYLGKQSISDALFYGFAISWMVTRLGYFPTWILYSITVEAGQFIQYFGAYQVFSALLSILLILNLFWAYFIFKVAYLAALAPDGKIEKDLRSESNSSD